MEEQKRVREFMTYLIEKHQIKLNDFDEETKAHKYLRNCNEDYQAFLTYKNREFFHEEETLAERAPKEATALIKYIVHRVTIRE